MIYNLVDNAIKFSHDNSTIRIDVYEQHDKIFISVKDTGIGIPKKDQKAIRYRFFKSDSSRGKDKKGTGLGLSIVKGNHPGSRRNHRCDQHRRCGHGIYLPPAEGTGASTNTVQKKETAGKSIIKTLRRFSSTSRN